MINIVIIQCAWCKDQMKKNRRWQKTDPLAIKQPNIVLGHGICPDCEAELQQAMEVEAAKLGLTLA